MTDRVPDGAGAAKALARAKPYYTELEAGRAYLWCACGRSRSQPYCDGSHRNTGIVPVRYEARSDAEEVLFCGCKRTCSPPFCDGAHNALSAQYPSDDPDAGSNRSVPDVPRRDGERAVLNGGCYVLSTRTAAKHSAGGYRWCEVVGASLGAIHQSQFYFETLGTAGAALGFGGHGVVLFIARGSAIVSVAGRPFDVPEHAGVAILPGEVFAVRAAGKDARVCFFATVGPRVAAPEFDPTGTTAFDQRFPNRVAPLDPGRQREMADRFFQVLVDRSHGSSMLTQFIGNIPLSKALAHRHLYEESLIVLSGHGRMWTENLRTAVEPGDVIFLPRKQTHSLECTDPASMFVVGAIYPGDNPAVNY